MSEHYCTYKDGMCELDVDEAYQQGRADAIEEFVKAFKDNMLKSTARTWTCYVDEIAKQMKEQNE